MRKGPAMVALTLAALGSACLLLTDLDALEGGAADAAIEAGSVPQDDARPPLGDGDPPEPLPDAGPDAEPDATLGCPGSEGARMIPIPSLGFCIDETEATAGHYRAFLAARGGDMSGQDPRCAANTTYAPQFGMPSAANDRDPIRFVDFCDALAFCAWAGKRVCGSRNDAPLAPAESNLPARSEWYAACSRNGDGLHTYPYGNEYVPGRCWDIPARAAADAGAELTPAGSRPECAGAYEGVLDLSGSVSEWEDSCTTTDAGLECAVRGGAYYHENFPLRCDHLDIATIDNAGAGFGIRCCSDL